MAPGQIYDVAVVGAGPAGSLIAARLAAAGLRTSLVEATDFHLPRVGEFLSPQARATLNQSGLLAPDWERAHGTVNEFLGAWGSPELVPRNYIFDAQGCALALDRTRFDQDLAEAAVKRGACLLTRARVRGVTSTDGWWDINIDQGKDRVTQRTRFLVIASGRSGKAIPAIPSQWQRLDALVCLGLRVSGYEGDMSPTIESYARGWVYSVGLPAGELVINLCTESDPASAHTISRSRGFLIKELANCPLAAARLLAAGTKADDFSFFAVDASSGCSRPAGGPGWCFAGDRAQSFDPLSSSGIAQALQNAELLSETIIRSQSFPDVDLSGFTAHLDKSYTDYVDMRRRVYGLEKRWASPFWSRRQSMPE